MKERSQYLSILRATSIFGGVQFVSIIIKIISTKFIAILLGPTGIGILSLFNSSIDLISKLTNFGIGTSSIKNVSEADSSKNQDKINEVSSIVKKIVWFTGALGSILTLIFSKQISEFTFGNEKYTISFVIISIVLFVNQLTLGEKIFLQGLRKIKLLAKSTITGSIISVIFTIPIYYIYGYNGIVPNIILTSFILFLCTKFYSRKLFIQKRHITVLESFSKGKEMIKMGFMISLGAILSSLSAYILRIVLNNSGGESEVGLFNAGFAIVNTYVGLVFSAMAADYYPRLSSVSKDNLLTKKIINQQAIISVIIIAPLIITFMIFIKWLIIILYSREFILITSMIYWASLGIFFKSISWSIGFIFLSKSNSKLYFWNEIISTSYMLLLNLLGYKLKGLEGIGISYLLSYILHLIQVYFVSKYFYDYKFENNLKKLFYKQILLASIGFLVTYYIFDMSKYFYGLILIFCSFYLSLKELNKILDLKTTFKKIIKNE